MEQYGAERRRWPRIEVQLVAAATPDGRTPIDCEIRDINGHGARIDFAREAPPGLFYLIDVWSNLGYQSNVAWRRGVQVGVGFTECWDLTTDPAPLWLKQVRRNLLRSYGEQRSFATFSSGLMAPVPQPSWEPRPGRRAYAGRS